MRNVSIINYLTGILLEPMNQVHSGLWCNISSCSWNTRVLQGYLVIQIFIPFESCTTTDYQNLELSWFTVNTFIYHLTSLTPSIAGLLILFLSFRFECQVWFSNMFSLMFHFTIYFRNSWIVVLQCTVLSQSTNCLTYIVSQSSQQSVPISFLLWCIHDFSVLNWQNVLLFLLIN